MFVETESMRIARLEQTLRAALDNADAIVLDEKGEPLIFERKDAPKEIEQLRPFGEVDISRELKLEHDGSWVDGRWYEWEDIHVNREVARMKLDAIDHFYPHAKIIKEEDVCRYRELEEGEDNAGH